MKSSGVWQTAAEVHGHCQLSRGKKRCGSQRNPSEALVVGWESSLKSLLRPLVIPFGLEPPRVQRLILEDGEVWLSPVSFLWNFPDAAPATDIVPAPSGYVEKQILAYSLILQTQLLLISLT